MLLSYSLAETQLDSSAYSMHPVVHEWCFHTMTENKDEVASLAIMVVGSACPLRTKREYCLLERRLLPHCKRILQWSQSNLQSVQDYEGLIESLSESFNNLGLLYNDQGKLKEAKEMYQRALKGKEKALGPEHTSTMKIAGNLRRLHERRVAISLKRMRAVSLLNDNTQYIRRERYSLINLHLCS